MHSHAEKQTRESNQHPLATSPPAPRQGTDVEPRASRDERPAAVRPWLSVSLRSVIPLASGVTVTAWSPRTRRIAQAERRSFRPSDQRLAARSKAGGHPKTQPIAGRFGPRTAVGVARWSQPARRRNAAECSGRHWASSSSSAVRPRDRARRPHPCGFPHTGVFLKYQSASSG
jgi:hypothetical protein